MKRRIGIWSVVALLALFGAIAAQGTHTVEAKKSPGPPPWVQPNGSTWS